MNIKKFRVLMAHNFFGNDIDYGNNELWFNGICHSSCTDSSIELLNKLCNTKKNSDIFFSCYKSPLELDRRTHYISHWIYEQPEPYASERLENWYKIKNHIDSIVQKYYKKKHWGEQKVSVSKEDITDEERSKVKDIIMKEFDKQLNKLTDSDYRRILILKSAVVDIK